MILKRYSFNEIDEDKRKGKDNLPVSEMKEQTSLHILLQELKS